jgi:quercetin dioxygenase-like cupin family protein
VEDAVLVELPDGLDQSWHNAPTRQLVFVLEGRIEVETSDGSKCSWGKGDLFFADDVAGKGHLTRVVHGLTKLLFLRLSDQFNLEKFLEDTDKG